MKRKYLIPAGLLALLCMIALSLRETAQIPSQGSSSYSQALAKFQADGTISRSDLSHGRIWVGAKFRALAFSEQEKIAGMADAAMSDRADLILLDAQTGAYLGTYDPDHGLAETVNGTVVSDAGVEPK